MFTQYFGNFLFESGVITLDQFRDALQQIPNKRAKLGVLAVESGYMTPVEVEKVHMIQLYVDKRFGELAVEEGYLTPEQLSELLSKQFSPFSVFSQIMCDAGYMTYAQLSEQIERYREKCGMTPEHFTQFKNDEIEPLVDQLLSTEITEKPKRLIVRSYIDVFIKNIYRFVSTNIMLGEITAVNSMEGDWAACQKITGACEVMACFTGSEKDMLYFAATFSHKEFSTFGILPRDVLGEFLNCNNGIFTSNMIEHGFDLGLDPQKVSDDTKITGMDSMLSIKFTIEQHSYRLYLAF